MIINRMSAFGLALREALNLKCKDKRRYSTYDEAVEVSKYRTTPGVKDHAKFLQPYLCEHGCGGFHITSRPFRDRIGKYPVFGDWKP